MSVERHSHLKQTPWTGEHIHRYIEAVKLVKRGDTVLDLACGSGYGTDLIGVIEGTTVYGGDIDTDTISACLQVWKRSNTIFEVMDATKLRFGAGFFNAIISLETIEHLTAYREMVAEFHRVLANDGTAVISTPNIKVSSPDGIVRNPYHTQEFTYDELHEILKEKFSSVAIWGQGYARYKHGERSLQRKAESFLLARGIRKLPYSFRNALFSFCFKTSLYPLESDYKLFMRKEDIEKHCHVLFAVCKK